MFILHIVYIKMHISTEYLRQLRAILYIIDHSRYHLQAVPIYCLISNTSK
nr:MAG TPA: hypothetical protein [Caudoviricetes sp.]